MTDQKLTDGEYVAHDGNVCPHCRSEKLQGGDTEFSGDQAFRDVKCLDCGEDWVETFKMIGWTPG